MNDAGLEQIYDQHAASVLAFLRQATRDSNEAEDLLQQLFQRLVADPRRLDGVRDLRGWLLRSAHHLFVDYCRSHASRRQRETETVGSQEVFSKSSDPDEELFRQELEMALAGLPADQRIVVHLKLWEDRTFVEIAEMLGLPPDTAASRYRYGIDKMRAQLRPLHDEIFGECHER